MKKAEYSFQYTKIESYNEFEASDLRLLEIAQEECINSFSPHSGFKVSAVALMSDGEILAATNQESDAFPSGMCAERILLYHIQAKIKTTEIETLLIYGETAKEPCSACGACREVISATQKRQSQPIRLVMCGGDKAIIVDNSNSLLPFSFNL